MNGFSGLMFDDAPEAHGHRKILGYGTMRSQMRHMIDEIALAIVIGANAEAIVAARLGTGRQEKALQAFKVT